MIRPLCAALFSMMLTGADASPREIAIDPSMTRISYTVYVFGFLPSTATFDRFQGRVIHDPDHPDACQVDVTVDVASLHMSDPDRRQQALANDMLDAADFPTMRFAGACQARSIVGQLTLHGITHALTLARQQDGPQFTYGGTLARGDFGVRGMRGIVGRTVRITLTVRLPP